MARKREAAGESARTKKALALKKEALQRDATGRTQSKKRTLREDEFVVIDIQLGIPRAALARLQRMEDWGDHKPPQRDPSWNQAQDSDYDKGPPPKRADTTGDMGKDGFGDPKG